MHQASAAPNTITPVILIVAPVGRSMVSERAKPPVVVIIPSREDSHSVWPNPEESCTAAMAGRRTSIDKQRTHYFQRNAYGDSGQEQEYISDPIGSDAEPLGLFRIIED